MRAWSLIVSIALHLTLVVAAHQNKKKDAAQEPPKEKGRLTLKIKKNTQTKPVEEQGDAGNAFLSKDGGMPKECRYSYYGIGWMGSVAIDGWCKASAVAPGSPLYRLGVRAGGLVMMQDGECPGRGEKGTAVTIVYKLFEEDAPKTATLIREKICTD